MLPTDSPNVMLGDLLGNVIFSKVLPMPHMERSNWQHLRNQPYQAHIFKCNLSLKLLPRTIFGSILLTLQSTTVYSTKFWSLLNIFWIFSLLAKNTKYTIFPNCYFSFFKCFQIIHGFFFFQVCMLKYREFFLLVSH